MNIFKLAAISSLHLPATAMVALAAGPHPAFKARHDNFERMGKATKSTFDELKKPAPNVNLLKANSNVIAAAAPRVKGYFPKGTGPEAGVKTEALPVIWQRNAEFNAAADKLVAAANNFKVAAATGDLAKIQPAAGAMGGTCKGCHDTFRKPRS